MNQANTFLVLILLAAFCYSCEKQEEQSIVRISIENFSEIEIDTLKIYSSSYLAHYSVNKEPIIFRNLTSGCVTEKIDCQDVEITLHFKAYVEGDSVRGRWHYPNSLIDPVGPVYMPSGNYCFGIIECDTAKGRIVIGLISG